MADGSAGGKPGFLTAAALKLLTRPGQVVAVETLTPRFRMVHLAGSGLKDVAWQPGHKLQLSLGGLTFRTFTPIAWDAAAGTARFLAYLHGDSPAARWLGGLSPGDAVLCHGPRRSLALEDAAGPMLFVGDETAIGPAASLAAREGGARFLFEASDPAESRAVLERLGVTGAEIVERLPGDMHHPALARALEAIGAPATAVLAGKAQTVQMLVKRLRVLGLNSARLRTKAYWSPGKTGLD